MVADPHVAQHRRRTRPGRVRLALSQDTCWVEAGLRTETATVDHRELCGQTKIIRWPWATA